MRAGGVAGDCTLAGWRRPVGHSGVRGHAAFGSRHGRYILDSGSVEVLVPSPSGRLISGAGDRSLQGCTVVHTVNPGEFFGEIALLTRERRTASCRAAAFCELWSLTRKDLQHVLEDYPEQVGQLQQHAQERLVRSMTENARKTKDATARRERQDSPDASSGARESHPAASLAPATRTRTRRAATPHAPPLRTRMHTQTLRSHRTVLNCACRRVCGLGAQPLCRSLARTVPITAAPPRCPSSGG